MTSKQTFSENPFDISVQKYWDRRYDLFSRYDQGIRLDRESLFSIKPEVSAIEICSNISENCLLDGMCGVGGISIASARLGKSVVAVDIDAHKIEMARHNATIYGVENKITFVNDDLGEYIKSHPVSGALYLDPPWGGPDYYKLEHFRLQHFSVPIADIIRSCIEAGTHVIISVPRNFDLNEILIFDARVKLLHSYSEGRRVFSTLFLRR